MGLDSQSVTGGAVDSGSALWANAEQAESWNGVDGRHWVAHRDRYEAMLRGFTAHLLDAARVSAGERVLDIGCGSGETTCAAGAASGHGQVLGVDLSGPMLDDARRRAEKEQLGNLRFEQADAQVHAFASAGFDVAISRFGVMFFADPAAAFTNIGRALRSEGRMAFLCWQQPGPNEWIMTLGGALAAHVELPQMDGPGPGPFSLADPPRIRELLQGAGFAQIAVDPVTEPMWLGGGVEDVIAFVQDLNLVRQLLTDLDPPARHQALDAVRAALQPHQTPHGVSLGGACWLVTARCGR